MIIGISNFTTTTVVNSRFSPRASGAKSIYWAVCGKFFMVVILPKIKIGNKTYYVDKRLSEIRNVKNPHDAETVSLEVINYWLEHDIREL